MTTPLFPTFRKRIDDAIENLIRQQVTPWIFLTAGSSFSVNTFDGRKISYGGVEFEGTPRIVFWSRYIEPFLEELCNSELSMAITMANEKGIDVRLLLPEVQLLLIKGCQRVYNSMADIDRRLRGKGYPSTVEFRSINEEITIMTNFIDERVRAEIVMWKPKSSVEIWYDRNKFWVWLIGILLSLIGLWIKLG